MSNRKEFLRQSALLAGGIIFSDMLWAKNYTGALRNKTDRRVRIGVIGLNGMGWANAMTAIQIPGVIITALCEVDDAVMEKRWKEMGEKNIPTSGVQRYKDYRSLLDSKEVDVVIIGTPDHWHALMMIHACQAGKHVYVENLQGTQLRSVGAWWQLRNAMEK